MSDETNFLDLNKYEKQSKIGQGAFAKVFKVLCKSTKKIYAAKISIYEIDESKESDLMNIKREINIMAQIVHPSILRFIGYSPIDFNEKAKPVIITEYSPNGTLSDIIKLERQSLSPELWNDTKKLINIFGIASAMKYLHANGIIHRDLKPENILEDDYLFPKIADFGLSKNYHQNKESITFQSTKNFKGTPIYASPEMWNSNEYTKACDVYAFSIIVYELVTLEEPFKNYSFMMFVSKVFIGGYRPEFKHPIPDCYRNLIESCWAKNPEERPTFDQIVEQLKNNEEFITDAVDKDEYMDYIDFIENSDTLFDPSKKFKKITFSKIQLNNGQIEKKPKNKKHKKINNNNDYKIDEIPGINIFHHSEFEINKIIGKGKNGYVYLTTEKKNGTKIAFKELYPDISKDEEKKTYREIEIMSQLDHLSIQKLYGYAKRNPKKFRLSAALSLFEENGSLNNLINKNPSELDFTQKYIIMYGIAAGMYYLHYNKIVHFDLKPKSILINNKIEPIISDFHFAQRSTEIFQIDPTLLMTNDLVYNAPELFKAEQLFLNDFNSAKSIDVYAFAFILMFIFIGEKPWNDIKQTLPLLLKITNNEKPEFPSNFPQMIRLLIEQCWIKDPKLRPSFESILYIIGSSIFINNIDQKIDLNRLNEYQNKVAFNGSFLKEDKYELVLINGVLFPKIVKKIEIDPFIYRIDVFDREDSFFSSYEVKSISDSYEYRSVIMIKGKYFNNTNVLNCFSSQIKIMLECEHPSLSTIYGNLNDGNSKKSSDKKSNIFDYFLDVYSLPYLAINSFYGNKSISNEINQLSMTDIFIILYGIAAAMYYLHKRGFVLLNLKPVNIVLNDHKPIIFIDIAARSTSDLNDNLTDIFKVFSYPYTAPELLNYKTLNYNSDLKKCDVYSFAMIAYYLYTKKHPFDIDIDLKSIIDKHKNNERPVIDENIPPPFVKLIKECWQENPSNRMSFKEILKMMGSQEFIDKYNDLDRYSFKRYQKTVVDKKFIYTLVNNDLIRKKDDFKLSRMIGDGANGPIRLACDTKDESMHAIKEYPQMQSIIFKRIVNILTTIDCPSIIHLHGIIEPVDQSDNYVVILPYAKNRDLESCINNNIKYSRLDYTSKCIILYGIAMGIYELHKHDIIHRNLSACNILINEFYQPWISGFSYAKFIDPDKPLFQSLNNDRYPDENFFTRTQSILYMSPESLDCVNEEIYLEYDGKMSDVYSFGLIAYHLMTGNRPFHTTKNYFTVTNKVLRGERPEFPQNIEEQFVDLISSCWNQTPEKRPTMTQICEKLSNPKFYISSTNHFNQFIFDRYKKNFDKIDIPNKIIETE